MTHIIAVANLKGGIGKTTLCLNVAAHIAQNKDVGRVLLVDFDPQANATSALGIDRRTLTYSIYDSLLHECEGYQGVPIDQIILETSVTNLHLAPSELDLGSAMMVMHPAKDRVSLLHRLLAPIRDFYDYILIDTPSDTGLLVLNSLRAADQVVAPLDMSVFSVEALENLRLYCHDLTDVTGHEIKRFTVVLNRCTLPKASTKKSGKPSPAEEIYTAIEATSIPIFTVPESVLAFRAQQAGVPVMQHSPKSSLNKAYGAIANHLVHNHQSPNNA